MPSIGYQFFVSGVGQQPAQHLPSKHVGVFADEDEQAARDAAQYRIDHFPQDLTRPYDFGIKVLDFP